jgi:hypothetical protein
MVIESNHATYNMIASIEYTLSRQRELQTISDDQEALIEKINTLKDSFDNIKINIGQEQRSLWEVAPHGDIHEQPFAGNNISFPNLNEIRTSIRL